MSSLPHPPSDRSKFVQHSSITPGEIVEKIDGLIDVYGDWESARPHVLTLLASRLGAHIHRKGVRERIYDLINRLGEVRMSHESIADYIGASRETVTRTLKRMESDGIVVRRWRNGVQRAHRMPNSTYTLRRKNDV